MNKGRPFAAFDIDGTLIRWQLYHAITDALAKTGLINAGEFFQVRNARMDWKRRLDSESFQKYELEVIKAFDKAVTNMSVEDFLAAVRNVFDEYKDQTYIYTRNLIKELKSRGYILFAISASQIEIVEVFARYYGFDDWAGSKYQVEDGKFTGKKFILKRGQKPLRLKTLVQKHSATYEGSIGLGDSDSDIQMLAAVENPIAFNPNKLLFEHAENKRWKVVIERKNMIYELENSDGKYELVKTTS